MNPEGSDLPEAWKTEPNVEAGIAEFIPPEPASKKSEGGKEEAKEEGKSKGTFWDGTKSVLGKGASIIVNDTVKGAVVTAGKAPIQLGAYAIKTTGKGIGTAVVESASFGK
eukprot:CAMPEP_0168325328 /NCGR_PEP_ID=MMETSP0213-20121227/4630_1 /TAXON_ID=151035 /ORGANISM="Euplotes harpa, Strain FSP1.4" /LENGTH=110 /DNA_ID=CAMNT_0008327807 /DNA_START=328 /DNA_END=661 /DNA_ORIENTATION=-